MAEHLLAQVNSQVLIWAREVLGIPFDVAARKIGVPARRLQEFESGRTLPTIRQLRTIAKLYRRPTAFFYLRTPPPKPEQIKDFRALPGQYSQELPEVLDAVDAAQQKRLTAIELARMLGYDITEFDLAASLGDAPGWIASNLRDRLGVSVSVQRSWRDAYQVLRGWIAAAERVGILVTQFSRVEVSAARGFSLVERPFPLVAINGKDSPRAKVFTLFHELVHIVLRVSGLCDLHETNGRADVIEPFCNRVAAETLVPSGDLLDDPLVTQHHDVEWKDWQVRELATSYGVSREVLLRRLLTLGRTSESFYRTKREEYLRAYADTSREGGGFLPYARRVLRDNGTAFSSLVLQAYGADLITPTEVSRFLGGIKLQHISDIEEALTARAG
jgi:Zn-dependent peptidase ImmA (M78 family)/transcriptional regulator with XRE-family HTH domain